MAGLWMPFDMLPETVEKIAHGLPQYWAMQGYQTLLFGTGDPGGVFKQVVTKGEKVTGSKVSHQVCGGNTKHTQKPACNQDS